MDACRHWLCDIHVIKEETTGGGKRQRARTGSYDMIDIGLPLSFLHGFHDHSCLYLSELSIGPTQVQLQFRAITLRIPACHAEAQRHRIARKGEERRSHKESSVTAASTTAKACTMISTISITQRIPAFQIRQKVAIGY